MPTRPARLNRRASSPRPSAPTAPITHDRRSCCAHASAYPPASHGGTNTSVAVSQYLGKGPYTVSQLPPLTFGVGQGRSGPLDCTVRVFLPQGQQQQQPPGGGSSAPRWPLVVLSAGFLLHSSMYGSYAADLASWGLAAVLYDLPEVVDDTVMVSAIGAIIDACTRDPRVSPFVDPRAILLAGHSRGGKLSVLAAAGDPRVKGLALLDPVDVTAMTPMGPGYPSALPAMRVVCGPPRRVPVLVVGAARNGAVIPANANYKRFISSCPGPCWSLELTGAGHLQFLDTKVDLFAAFVESGPAPDEAVRRASKVALLTWALDLAVPLARGEPLSGGQVLERLQQASSLVERQTDAMYSFKGFDALGSSPGAAAAGGSGAQTASDRGQGARAAAASASSASSASTSSPYSSSSFSSSSTGYGSRPAEGAPSAGASAAASGSASAGGQTSRGTSSTGRGGGGGGSSSSKWSYEELLRMRARELKAILVERGVDCSDCFEKEDLARRIMERC